MDICRTPSQTVHHPQRTPILSYPSAPRQNEDLQRPTVEKDQKRRKKKKGTEKKEKKRKRKKRKKRQLLLEDSTVW